MSLNKKLDTPKSKTLKLMLIVQFKSNYKVDNTVSNEGDKACIKWNSTALTFVVTFVADYIFVIECS